MFNIIKQILLLLVATIITGCSVGFEKLPTTNKNSTPLISEQPHFLTRKRAGHTATLLNNGKVLIVGGSGTWSGLGAEIFDPATGSTTGVESMIESRSQHTATLLSNGKVLITGGANFNGQRFKSAEVYDPTTGAFTLTGEMTMERIGHTATLLNNGKVLIAGGVRRLRTPKNAEIYDPITGTFALTGEMTDDRDSHTATLLNNGKVLLTGGYLSSTEIYDPTTGLFLNKRSMHVVRANHTATLLNDGKVLIAGGNGAFVVEGSLYPGCEKTAEVYDPATGRFSITGSMVDCRRAHTASVLSDGKILIAGGFDTYYRDGKAKDIFSLSSVEVYDPSSNAFKSTSSMVDNRSYHTATVLINGNVLIIGGYGKYFGESINMTETYDAGKGVFLP